MYKYYFVKSTAALIEKRFVRSMGQYMKISKPENTKIEDHVNQKAFDTKLTLPKFTVKLR